MVSPHVFCKGEGAGVPTSSEALMTEKGERACGDALLFMLKKREGWDSPLIPL